jgi:hypothetical protein
MKMKILAALLLSAVCVQSVAAQSEIVPLLEMNVGGLMGGVQNGKFVDAKTTFARLKGKGKYSIYGPRGRVGEMTTEVEAPTPDEPCDDFYSFKSELENVGGIAVGANPGWNLTPRAAKTLDLKNAVYVKAASDVLKSKGIVNRNPKIRQALRVDLEGDGQEEVLLAVTSYDSFIKPSAEKGDYSFILLRKIVGGKVRNIVVTGDFITKKIEFGAPGKFEISSIADLNGDGKMEIVVYGAYYEGNWVEVYEMKAGKPTDVKALSAACGV